MKYSTGHWIIEIDIIPALGHLVTTKIKDPDGLGYNLRNLQRVHLVAGIQLGSPYLT
jgi:hypothetical protein